MMTQQPPVPQASHSPYPIDEAPHEKAAAVFDQVDWARDEPEFSLRAILDEAGVSSRAALGVGAAVGLGLLVGLAAAVFSGRSKPGRAPAKRRTAAVRTKAPAKRTTASRAASKPKSPAKRTAAKKPAGTRSPQTA